MISVHYKGKIKVEMIEKEKDFIVRNVALCRRLLERPNKLVSDK